MTQFFTVTFVASLILSNNNSRKITLETHWNRIITFIFRKRWRWRFFMEMVSSSINESRREEIYFSWYLTLDLINLITICDFVPALYWWCSGSTPIFMILSSMSAHVCHSKSTRTDFKNVFEKCLKKIGPEFNRSVKNKKDWAGSKGMRKHRMEYAGIERNALASNGMSRNRTELAGIERN